MRNLPFQASVKEVRELMSAFGQLKTVRLPKKFDGTHRGFAFVEYVSKAEAAKAMGALHATHLYGRHLVLQYAEQERSVEQLREKVRSQMGAGDDESGRKRRKGGDGEDEGYDEDVARLIL